MVYTSSNYPPAVVTQEAITVRALHQDGDRLYKVDRFLNLAYPTTVLYSIYRATQHPHLEYFFAEEIFDIATTVIGARAFLAWCCWRTLKIIFTPSKLIIKNGFRSYILDAKENYGFSSIPHEDRRIRKSQYLLLTHRILLEHRSHGTILLGNFYGELVAKKVVTKLQGLKDWINTLEIKTHVNRTGLDRP